MVVVNGQIGIKRCFLGRLVVLGAEFHARYGRSFKVNVYGELKDVSCVVLIFVFAVIDIRFYSEPIFGVVFKFVFERAEFDIDRRTVNRAASAAVRFSLIFNLFSENLFSGNVFGCRNINGLCVAQKSRGYRSDARNRVVGVVVFRNLIGYCDVFFICGDLRILGVLLEIVSTHGCDIVAVKSAGYARRISVCHQLVVVVDRAVEFVFIGVVIFFVEYRSFGPVAVETEERYVKIDRICSLIIES